MGIQVLWVRTFNLCTKNLLDLVETFPCSFPTSNKGTEKVFSYLFCLYEVVSGNVWSPKFKNGKQTKKNTNLRTQEENISVGLGNKMNTFIEGNPLQL